MLGLDGSGLEVHLSQCRDSPHKYRLVFTSVDEEQQYSPTEMKEAELELTEGNWHFFAFSVFQKAPANKVFAREKGSDNLVVYVDHHQTEREFPFPRCFSSGGATKPPTIGDSARYSANYPRAENNNNRDSSTVDGQTTPSAAGDGDGLLSHDQEGRGDGGDSFTSCLLYTSPSPRDGLLSRMPSSA